MYTFMDGCNSERIISSPFNTMSWKHPVKYDSVRRTRRLEVAPPVKDDVRILFRIRDTLKRLFLFSRS